MSKSLNQQPKRPLPLKWEITLALVCKLLLLYVIWALWFDQPVPKEQRADSTARIILNR